MRGQTNCLRDVGYRSCTGCAGYTIKYAVWFPPGLPCTAATVPAVAALRAVSSIARTVPVCGLPSSSSVPSWSRNWPDKWDEQMIYVPPMAGAGSVKKEKARSTRAFPCILKQRLNAQADRVRIPEGPVDLGGRGSRRRGRRRLFVERAHGAC